MNFYGNRRTAAIWIALSAFQIAGGALRLHRHGLHDAIAISQLIVWAALLLFWVWFGSIRWRFSPAALEQRRIGSSLRAVPYGDIASVGPTSTNRAAESFQIVYGAKLFGQQERMVVFTENRTGFLEELERRAPGASFNV